MTDKRFRLAEHLLETKPWELFAMVEIGLDRMHHGFWKDLDELHHRHEPDGPYAGRDPRLPAAPRRADRARCSSTPTTRRVVLVVSDHGAKRMEGGIRVNEWLRREGLLQTAREPRRTSPRCATSASTGAARPPGARAATTAGSSSTSRGREPEGTVAPEDFERVRDELAERLAAIPGPTASRSPRASTSPRSVYEEVNGVAPDLLVYFGDLALARGRDGRRRRTASTPSRTTPAPTTPTTPRTAC